MAKISTLIDDFQDNVIDTSKWTVTGGTETGGRAVLTPSTSFAYWSADASYDLTASQITANIPVVTNVGTSGSLQSGFALERDPNNYIGMRVFNNELLCTKRVAGTETQLSFTPYSATNHLYWRIRESGGNVYWETSATGTGTFFIQHTEGLATLFDLTALFPYFFAGWSSGFEPSPGTLQIESVNPGQQLTAAGTSTSSGTVHLLILHRLSASGTSTSSGSAAITIPPLTHHSITASGSSTSTGQASFIILAPDQLTASGQSYSSGSAALTVLHNITAVGQSFSTGTALFTVVAAVSLTTQYFYFEPPIAYDLPATLPNPRPRYLNAHARWKGGQRRGRSVLKLNGVYQTIDTPTVDQTHAATEVYMGGHIYTITNITADALVAAGYTVIPIPINWTLYPGEDVFPEANLFPGYQELIPDQVAV